MAKIKTRDAAKSGAKAAGKGISAGERMKRAYTRARSHARSDGHTDHNSPEEYADEQMARGVESIVQEGAVQIRRQGKRGFRSIKERMAKETNGPTSKYGSKLYSQTPMPGPGDELSPSGPTDSHGPSPDSPSGQAKQWGKERAAERSRTHRFSERAPHTVKTVDRAHQEIKTIDRENGKINKPAKKTVKTAQYAERAAIKTAEQPAKVAEQAAQVTAKAATVTAQAAQSAAKATVQRAKAAAKATVSTIKAILAAAKAQASAIIAGGWAALLVLVFVCLIGLIVASPFGIFFSGEDSGSGQTMQTAVREINENFQAKIDTIKASTSYDALELSGSRADWKEVLAIYAVKTATDPDSAQEVASMDDSKKAILQSIFWEMTTISSWTETDSSTDTELRDDGHGNMVEVEVTTTYTTLYISISHKTADEMAAQLHFTPTQFVQLAELLAEENNGLWNAVLYGISNGEYDIVSVALSQVGNVGGDPYWSWYGFPSHVDWCACFVSWCANECGYIDAGAFPKFAGCSTGAAWFQDRGLWRDNTYEPHPGDIIFFDWDDENDGQDGSPDHVGIVEKMEENIVYTVEGNSGDACREKSYSMGYYEIYGYGILEH